MNLTGTYENFTTYDRIFAKPDLEGAIAAGLLNRLFDTTIYFEGTVVESRKGIIIEIDDMAFDSVANSLIIDHRLCEEYRSLMQNLVICDNRFINSVHLISNFFDMDIDDEIIEIVYSFETSIIVDEVDDIVVKYLANYFSIPLEEIAKSTRKGDWGELLEKLKSGSPHIGETKEAIDVRVKPLGQDYILISYNHSYGPQYYSARLLSKRYQRRNYNVILLETAGDAVFQGYALNKAVALIKKVAKRSKTIKLRINNIDESVVFFRALSNIDLERFQIFLEKLV